MEGVIFKCRLSKPEELPAGVLFDVKWYSEKAGETRKEIVTYPGTQSRSGKNGIVRLYETDYYGVTDVALRRSSPIGGKIYCSVQLRNGSNGIPSKKTFSAGFYAGIKILTEKLTINEKDTEHIKVKATIPILRGSIWFGLVLPDYQLNSCNALSTNQEFKLDYTECSLVIRHFNRTVHKWDDYKNREFTIPVKGKADDKYGDKIMSIAFKNTEVTLSHLIWSYMRLPDIQVKLTDVDIQLKNKRCYSHNDPHMQTFDGWRYENQNVGEFVLYKHKTMPVQVNTFYVPCNRRATCNCAAAVRAGKDVFIVDMCNNKNNVYQNYNTKKPFRVGVTGCDKKRMTVVRNGRLYTVTLPTGTQVFIRKSGRGGFLEVDIKPSILDINQSEGLCGKLNGIKDDDLVPRHKNAHRTLHRYPDDFSLSWRVNNAESLYDGVKSDESYAWHVYCKCIPGNNKIGTVNCTYDDSADTCMTRGKLLSKHAYQKCDVSRRKRRSAEKVEKLTFEYDANFTAKKPEWINGWTEAKARDNCTQYVLKSSTGKTCGERVSDIDMEGPIENCVRDIHISGGIDWRASAVNDVKVQCEIEVKKNTSLWTKDPNTGYLKLPSDILDNLCPENCSGLGICVNETCHCDKGYGDEDCSTDLQMAPTDVFIQPEDASCENNDDPCDSIPIFGDNFAESDDLVCTVRHCEVKPNGQECKVGTVVPAEYEHFQKVNCPIPSNRRKRSLDLVLGDVYHASVSNNGLNFSTEVTMITFDSLCTECNSTSMTCTLKNETCLIHDSCYLAGAQKSTQNCLTCQPNVSISSWTQKKSECFIENVCYKNGSVDFDLNCKMCIASSSYRNWTAVHESFCLTTSSSTSEEPTTTSTSTSPSNGVPTTTSTESSTKTSTETPTTPSTELSTTTSTESSTTTSTKPPTTPSTESSTTTSIESSTTTSTETLTTPSTEVSTTTSNEKSITTSTESSATTSIKPSTTLSTEVSTTTSTEKSTTTSTETLTTPATEVSTTTSTEKSTTTSNETPTTPSTESSTTTSTESSIKTSTETPITPSTEVSTTTSTEKSNTTSTVTPTTPSTESSTTTTSTETSTTTSTETLTSPSNGVPTTTSTESSTTNSTETPTSPSNEVPTTTSTESSTTTSTETPTTPSTKVSTTTSTESSIITSTESSVKTSTKPTTKPSTEPSTTTSTESSTTSLTETPTTPSTETPTIISAGAPNTGSTEVHTSSSKASITSINETPTYASTAAPTAISAEASTIGSTVSPTSTIAASITSTDASSTLYETSATTLTQYSTTTSNKASLTRTEATTTSTEVPTTSSEKLTATSTEASTTTSYAAPSIPVIEANASTQPEASNSASTENLSTTVEEPSTKSTKPTKDPITPQDPATKFPDSETTQMQEFSTPLHDHRTERPGNRVLFYKQEWFIIVIITGVLLISLIVMISVIVYKKRANVDYFNGKKC